MQGRSKRLREKLGEFLKRKERRKTSYLSPCPRRVQPNGRDAIVSRLTGKKGKVFRKEKKATTPEKRRSATCPPTRRNVVGRSLFPIRGGSIKEKKMGKGHHQRGKRERGKKRGKPDP